MKVFQGSLSRSRSEEQHRWHLGGTFVSGDGKTNIGNVISYPDRFLLVCCQTRHGFNRKYGILQETGCLGKIDYERMYNLFKIIRAGCDWN